MTHCATFSARVPAPTSTCPPMTVDCSSSAAPRPCWPSWEPRNGTSAPLPKSWRHSAARNLTEPVNLDHRSHMESVSGLLRGVPKLLNFSNAGQVQVLVY